MRMSPARASRNGAAAAARKADTGLELDEGVGAYKGIPAGPIPEGLYSEIHRTTPVACVDVAVVRGGKVLLVRREREPARGEWWLPGGRIRRDESVDKAASRLLLGEAGLRLRKWSMLGAGEMWFQTDPFGHGLGTHSLSVVILCEAMSGRVSLDGDHSDHIWACSPGPDLHPYVSKFVAAALGRSRCAVFWSSWSER